MLLMWLARSKQIHYQFLSSKGICLYVHFFQAGKPKTITGFQTHTTPVLLAHGERAELATEEYIPVTSIMEGFVILKKNPDF